MEFLQSVFDNREIATVFWVVLVVVLLMFTKATRDFLKTIVEIISNKHFIVFGVVFLSFLGFVIYGLYKIGMWSTKLIKDTIFWVMFVELPLFAKTIEEAKDERFFRNLIKENIAISVGLEFLTEFWTFDLFLEILRIPLLVFVSGCYAVVEKKKKHKRVKGILQIVLMLLGIFTFLYAIWNLICYPKSFFTIDTLKEFMLPIMLLVLNLPVVFGLAIYNSYEQIFISLKGPDNEKRKMKLSLILFAGINLYKLTKIRNNKYKTIIISLTNEDLKTNLSKLQKELDLQIGDNYMKRSIFYVRACIIGLCISIVGLITVNTEVSLKDLFAFNFVLNMSRVKEIFTYIFSTMIVVTIALLILAIGFKKKKKEEISQIKKYALYEILEDAKKQEALLLEYPPIDDPAVLYTSYVYNANQIKKSCTKVLNGYENLLTSWERDTLKSLQAKAIIFVGNFIAGDAEILPYNVESFKIYYETKVKESPQKQDFNVFTNMVKGDLEKYVEEIKRFSRDFKNYY